MKLLLVDDQEAIVNSLRKAIPWNTLGIDEVFTACSAAEAKLLLVNFPIDIMLTDIEMPEEDGLSLVQWTRERDMEICCIFLTSHADFEYARKSIGLGGFDYILQPARYEDIAAAVKKACGSVAEARQVKWLQKMQQEMVQQRDIFLAALIGQLEHGSYTEAGSTLTQLTDLLQIPQDNRILYSVRVFIRQIQPREDTMEPMMKGSLLRNVMEELFQPQNARACVVTGNGNSYCLLLLAPKEQMNDSVWEKGLGHFYHFVSETMKTITVIFASKGISAFVPDSLTELASPYQQTEEDLTPGLEGVVWKFQRTEDRDARIETVKEYIRTHVNRNITRTEVANLVYLDEDYFSKLFRQYTGWTFKEYVLKEKMAVARQLLTNTNLSVGLIASRLGFDNFSHFSRTFKKISDTTPQEYRRLHQKLNP